MRLILVCLALLLPVAPVAAHHHHVPAHLMCPFTHHCPQGPIPGH